MTSKSVDAGEAEIEHHQVRRAAADFGERRLAGLFLDDVVALGAQAGAKKAADRRLVIDDENPQRRPRRSCRRSFPAAVLGWCASAETGSVSVKIAP